MSGFAAKAWKVIGVVVLWAFRIILVVGLVSSAGFFAYEAVSAPGTIQPTTFGTVVEGIVRFGLVMLPVGSSINVWYKEFKALPLTWWDKRQPAISILVAVGFLIRFATQRWAYF